MKVKALVVAAIASGLALSAALVLPAAADEQLPADDRAAIVAFWTENDVSATTQESLLAKIERGEMLDSDRSGTEAVSQETTEVDGLVKTVSTYADGSVGVTEVADLAAAEARAESGMQPQASIKNCKYSGSTYAAYWTGCQASHTSATVSLAFRFDYSNTRDIGSKLTKAYTPDFSTRGGTFTKGPAFTRLSTTAMSYGGTFTCYASACSDDVRLTVQVKGNTASAAFG